MPKNSNSGLPTPEQPQLGWLLTMLPDNVYHKSQADETHLLRGWKAEPDYNVNHAWNNPES